MATEQQLLLSLAIVLVSIIFLYFYQTTKSITTGLIHRPPSLPFIGHAHHFLPTTLIDTLQVFRKKYGPVYELYLFSQRFFVLHDSELIKEVTTKRPKIFRRDHQANRAAIDIHMDQGSLFFTEGHTWSRLRRLLSTPFNRSNSDAMNSSIKKEISFLLQRLSSTKGEVVNANSAMMQFTLQVILRVAMGSFPQDDYVQSGKFALDTNLLFDYFMERIFYSDFLWRFVRPFSLYQKAMEANMRIESLVSLVIDSTSTTDAGSVHIKGNSSKSFIDILMTESKAVKPSPEDQGASAGAAKLSQDEVLANIKTMILAGSETTSVVLSWCLFFLSQSPTHLQRLREEVDALPSLDEDSDSTTRLELPFSAACFKEAMRLRTPAPFIAAGSSFSPS
jgi:cytochrome P450